MCLRTHASGKSTVARALELALQQEGGRKVTLLDGETIRQELSAELGYSRTDRDLNISRMSFVAAELTKAGAAVICASIAPFDEARRKAEEAIGKHGGFFLIYMNTPLDQAIKRDRQGVYQRAIRKEIQGTETSHVLVGPRRGYQARMRIVRRSRPVSLFELAGRGGDTAILRFRGTPAGFTGVDDSYEQPNKYAASFDVSKQSVSQIVHEIILLLEKDGYIGSA